MPALLDNIMWNCLSGPHAPLRIGRGQRAPLCAGLLGHSRVRSSPAPDFATLSNYCQPGEHFYCDQWTGAAARGLADRARGDDAQDGVGRAHAGRRCGAGRGDAATGAFSAGAGLARSSSTPDPSVRARRSSASISATSTDGSSSRWPANAWKPGHCAKSAASARTRISRAAASRGRLTLKLVHRQMRRGLTPFLHVMTANTGARALYEKIGFRNYLETVVRVISRFA